MRSAGLFVALGCWLACAGCVDEPDPVWIKAGTYRLVGARMESEGKKETYTVKGEIEVTWEAYDCRREWCPDASDQYCRSELSAPVQCILERVHGKGVIGSKQVDCTSTSQGYTLFKINFEGHQIGESGGGVHSNYNEACIPTVFTKWMSEFSVVYKNTDDGAVRIYEVAEGPCCSPHVFYSFTLKRVK